MKDFVRHFLDPFVSGGPIHLLQYCMCSVGYGSYSRGTNCSVTTQKASKQKSSLHLRKQVLWESAGAFFSARQLVSSRKSHSSGVRGLVVRCLLFNPEVEREPVSMR